MSTEPNRVVPPPLPKPVSSHSRDLHTSTSVSAEAPVTVTEVARSESASSASNRSLDDKPTDASRESIVVPVVKEILSVGKQWVDREKVVIRVEPRQEQQSIDLLLQSEQVEVERVPKNEFVNGRVEPRQEGDVTVVPVYEEVLVVEKRLVLKEEIRLVRRRVETRESRQETVRTEEVRIERVPLTASPGSDKAR